MAAGLRRGPVRRGSAGSAALSLCIAALIVLPLAQSPLGAAPSYLSYLLYYGLEIPPLLTGYEMDEQQNRHPIYTGLLRGTLGGLPVQRSAFTLRPGASAGAGGGEFSLQTAAGAVKNGLILMTTDGRQISLWFSGIYLGTRLQFRLATQAKDFGTATVGARGLAETNFTAHAEYLAAVTQAVANLAPAARAEAITQADRNPGLVAAYERAPGSP